MKPACTFASWKKPKKQNENENNKTGHDITA